MEESEEEGDEEEGQQGAKSRRGTKRVPGEEQQQARFTVSLLPLPSRLPRASGPGGPPSLLQSSSSNT